VHELGEKQFHRLLVHCERSILSYSLDILARVARGDSQPSTLDASMERVAGHDSNVIFFRLAEIGQRILRMCGRDRTGFLLILSISEVMYASKRLLQVTPSLNVLEATDVSGAIGKRKKRPAMFQPVGEVSSIILALFAISQSDASLATYPRMLLTSLP
jgi:RHO1 GDP-GTP exchange protein 1/2